MTCKTAVEGLHAGKEDSSSANTSLQEDSIDACGCQIVENVCQLSFLLNTAVGMRPVNAANGRKPYSSRFIGNG